MPHDYQSIPEFATRHAPSGLVRLPPGDDVPLTPRLRRLIDTPAYRALSDVSQLGLVRLVYPGAGHTRFEHSLGVYRVALDFLGRLSSNARFAEAVSVDDATRFLLAALLHDVGHWPYCHPLEDIAASGVVHHEKLARRAIGEGPLAQAIAEDWHIEPESVADLIEGAASTPGERIVSSMLSGPIDVDKIDYLARDSMHCGVPYGRNFDQSRLIASLCLNEAGDAIAVTDKGKTAAELMVFARYVMFSEVYWHHAVRSATAMLQRAIFELQHSLNWEAMYAAGESQWLDRLRQSAAETPAAPLVEAVFGVERRLYKRLAQYSFFESPELYSLLARRPYEWLVDVSRRLSERLSQATGSTVEPHEVLFDAPPVKLEVQFDVEVYTAKQREYRPLGEVSPVVRTLAKEQFDDYVKRVRVFASPRVVELTGSLDVDALVADIAG